MTIAPEDLPIIMDYGLLLPRMIQEALERPRADLWKLAGPLRQVKHTITLSPEDCWRLADLLDPEKLRKEGRHPVQDKWLYDMFVNLQFLIEQQGSKATTEKVLDCINANRAEPVSMDRLKRAMRKHRPKQE